MVNYLIAASIGVVAGYILAIAIRPRSSHFITSHLKRPKPQPVRLSSYLLRRNDRPSFPKSAPPPAPPRKWR